MINILILTVKSNGSYFTIEFQMFGDDLAQPTADINPITEKAQ